MMAMGREQGGAGWFSRSPCSLIPAMFPAFLEYSQEHLHPEDTKESYGNQTHKCFFH